MATFSGVPPAHEPFVDPKTGVISEIWYRFLYDAIGTTFNAVVGQYQADTWTVALTGSTGNPTTTYTTNSANYIRIGDAVMYRFSVVIATIAGGSGDARFSLPLTAGSEAVGACYTSGVDWSTNTQVVFGVQANVAYGQIVEAASNTGGLSSIQISDLANGDAIAAAGWYPL